MATKNPVKNPLYFGFSCSYLKNEVSGPHFLLSENNQHVGLKLSGNFKKIRGSGFRATLIFQKIKVALNPLPRIFFEICSKFNRDMLIIFQQ